MVGKNQIKLIKSLRQKKYRNLHNLFVAEGIKMVKELLDSDFDVYAIYTTDLLILGSIRVPQTLVSEIDLGRMSALKNPSPVLGVFYRPRTMKIEVTDWILALDQVSDPGNLGTIIRLCDWFGIRHLICSPDTVDCYNPKVLQATMGSIARVNVVYRDLADMIKESGQKVFGAFMDGDVLGRSGLPPKGILVMGNEANGISSKISALCDQRVAIPQFGPATAESLNVASATAILLHQIRGF
ncbi:MAG: RNA methyltransferase [Bacteroidota bacterium]